MIDTMTSNMARAFLTHSADMLRNYYGERALAALRQHADVTVNPTGQVLDGEALTRLCPTRCPRSCLPGGPT
jgi:hypothetical protein